MLFLYCCTYTGDTGTLRCLSSNWKIKRTCSKNDWHRSPTQNPSFRLSILNSLSSLNGNLSSGGGCGSYHVGHFVTVSDYDSDSGVFTISDSIDRSPRQMTGEGLENDMDGISWDSSAVAISHPSQTLSALPKKVLMLYYAAIKNSRHRNCLGKS